MKFTSNSRIPRIGSNRLRLRPEECFEMPTYSFIYIDDIRVILCIPSPSIWLQNRIISKANLSCLQLPDISPSYPSSLRKLSNQSFNYSLWTDQAIKNRLICFAPYQTWSRTNKVDFMMRTAELRAAFSLLNRGESNEFTTPCTPYNYNTFN